MHVRPSISGLQYISLRMRKSLAQTQYIDCCNRVYLLKEIAVGKIYLQDLKLKRRGARPIYTIVAIPFEQAPNR